MTANAYGVARAACLAAGMCEHIAKPVDPPVLFATLLRWLPQRPVDGGAMADGAATAPSLVAEFSGIPGLDATTGLLRVGGRPEAYRHLLLLFATHHGDGLAPLAEALAAGRLDVARLLVHSLKGASGAIAATDVAARAARLEADILASEPAARLEAGSAALRQALGALVDALEQRFGGTLEADEAAADTGDTEALLDRLDALLGAADFDAGATLRAGAPQLRARFGAALDTVLLPLERYDYRGALAALRALRAPPPRPAVDDR
jgi:HPt (histidine-containing phosphotransfer) domain-containing protein